MGNFNFWFILAPLLLFGSAALGRFSITNVGNQVFERWRGLQVPCLYSVMATAVVCALILLESIDGLLQCGLDCLVSSDYKGYGVFMAWVFLTGFLVVYCIVCLVVYAISADKRRLQVTQQCEAHRAKRLFATKEEENDYVALESIFRQRNMEPAPYVLYTKDLIPIIREARAIACSPELMESDQVYVANVPVRRRRRWWQLSAREDAVIDLSEPLAIGGNVLPLYRDR